MSDDKKTDNDAVNDFLLTDFPEPEMLGEGMLATDGSTYFQSILSEGNKINVNDSVLILTDDKQEIRQNFTYCGRIIKFFRTKDGQNLAKVNWYWRREELPIDAQSFLLQRELLLSERTDIIHTDSIKIKITVHSSPEPLGKDANKESEVLTDEFFCNRAFSTSRHEFIALSTMNRLLKQSEEMLANVEGATKLELAKAKLQLNFVHEVSGREAEIEKIMDKLCQFLLKNGPGDCLYISGVPGTGKTLCVREVMRRMAQEQLDANVAEYDYYEVNCLQLESPKDIFVEIWYQMSGEKLNATASRNALNEVFLLDPPLTYIILLVDEVDVLLTNQQSELYCLLEWSNLNKSRFILICIANLMDLDSRLMPKLASRFGKNSVKFFPYKHNELQNIINARVQDLDLYEQSAIEYCSKQISNIGGDARKALEACKKCLDMLQNEDEKVNLDKMIASIKELQSTRALNLLNNLSMVQQIFLVALLQDMKVTSRTIVPVRDIIRRQLVLITQSKAIQPVSQQVLLHVGNSLVEMKVIKCIKETYMTANTSITLQCMEYDIKNVIKKNPLLSSYVA